MSKLRNLLAATALAAAALTGAAACSADDPSDSSAGESGESGDETITVVAATTVIDVRTPAEFASGHLEDAVNIDLSAADFEARISALDPSAAYVVYCHSGNRSAQAAAIMADLGFDDVVDAGGLEDAAGATGLAVTS